ncbi:MAG: chemotaxis protein CheW [Methanomicrobiales archaeon]
MMDDTGEYRELFVAESREIHQDLVSGILELEDGRAEDVIDEIFRGAHTIKGMAGSMGFAHLERLCHAMEDVFDRIRNREMSVTPALVDTLLSCADTIERMIDSIEEGGDDAAAAREEHLDALRAFLTGDEEADATSDAESPPEEPAPSPEDVGGPRYRVEVTFSSGCEMRDLRAMIAIENLNDLGRVVASTPSMEDLDAGTCPETVTFIVSSEAGADALRAAVQGTDIDAVRVEEEPEKEHPLSSPDSGEPAEKKREIKSIRVDLDRLDRMMNLVEDLVINRGRLGQIAQKHNIREFDEALGMVGRAVYNLQNLMMEIRMIPLTHIFNRLPRVVRDTAHHDGKEVSFTMEGGDTEMDRSVMDGLYDPLLHIIRNAVNHGIEMPEVREANGKPRAGNLQLRALRDSDNVIIEVIDDGAGIDADRVRAKAVSRGILSEEEADQATRDELFNLIFEPGFSTAETISDISGRGVGLDVVKSTIESLNGSVRVESTPGEGSRFVLVLPPTMAIVEVIMVRINRRRCAIPIGNVVEVAAVENHDIHQIAGTEVIQLREEVLPFHRLDEMFGTREWSAQVVVLHSTSAKYCLMVDGVEGQQEVVVKPLGSIFGKCPGINGVTIPDDGDVVPVLDINTMV